MMNYLLTIQGGNVTTFNENTQDWTGEEFYKTVDIEISFSCEKLNWESIANALIEESYLLPYELNIKEFATELKESAMCDSFTVLENGDGEPDDEGKFLVDYWYTIKPISENIDLSTIL